MDRRIDERDITLHILVIVMTLSLSSSTSPYHFVSPYSHHRFPSDLAYPLPLKCSIRGIIFYCEFTHF